MKVKEESEKIGLMLNIQKTKMMASGPITLWEIDGKTVETVSDFILGCSKITADGDCSHEIKRCLLLGRKVMTNLDSIRTSLVAQMVKRLSTVRETWVRKIRWRRKWQSTPVLLPGKFHGQRSLLGYSPWGRRESDTTKRLHSITFFHLVNLSRFIHTIACISTPFLFIVK